MEYPTINVELFEKVKAAILEEPRRANMNFVIKSAENRMDDPPECGTTGCIAGWAIIIDKTGDAKKAKTVWEDNYRLAYAMYADHYMTFGAQALGLTANQAWKLFLSDYWPPHLQNRLYQLNPYTNEYVQVMADAIDEFLANPDKFVNEER